MAAKRSLRDAMQEARSVVWSFHSSDERRCSAPAKTLPFGFDSGILPSALRADACGVVQNRSRRFCRSIGPDYFVARLANARRPFGTACASYPSQCVRNAAHAEIRDRFMYVRSLGWDSESDLKGNKWFTGRTMRSLTNAMKMS